MATFSLAQPTFSLQQAKIAANNGDGTFGTAVIVPSVKILGIDLKTISDMAQGDSRITAAAAQLINIDFTLDVAGLDFPSLVVMLGQASSSSGSGGTLEKYISLNNFRYPYFGIVGQAWAAESGGDSLVWLPKCKIMSGPQWKNEFGKLNTPQFKAVALYDDFVGVAIQIIARATAASPTLPPT